MNDLAPDLTTHGPGGGDANPANAEDAADRSQARLDQLRRAAAAAFGQTREQVRQAVDERTRRARQRLAEATDLIERKPAQALGVAFLFGLMLGLLAGSGRSDRMVLVERC